VIVAQQRIAGVRLGSSSNDAVRSYLTPLQRRNRQARLGNRNHLAAVTWWGKSGGRHDGELRSWINFTPFASGQLRIGGTNLNYHPVSMSALGQKRTRRHRIVMSV
jgi:hypothetical protein